MQEVKTPHFHVVETHGSFRNEIGEMTEMQVYAHVRTRGGCGMVEAEAVLAELSEKGATAVGFRDSLGTETRIDIRRI